MKDMGIIQGSAKQAQELIIGYDTVYVHTNIKPVMNDETGEEIEGIYEFHEIQYTKDEYIKLMAETNIKLEKQLTNTQLALCSIYENMEV